MKIQITLNTIGANFANDFDQELARVLHVARGYIVQADDVPDTVIQLPLHDTNGNTVGQVVVTQEDS